MEKFDFKNLTEEDLIQARKFDSNEDLKKKEDKENEQGRKN